MCFVIPHTAYSEETPRFRWAQHLTSDTHLWLNGLAVDSSGNSYACGYMPGTGIFGSIVLTNYAPFPWRAKGGCFLVKYGRDGTVAWAIQDGAQANEALAVGLDSNENVYALCNLRNDSVPLGGTNVFGALGLAKYASDGRPIWGRSVANGNLSIDGGALAVTQIGECYWAVTFGGSITVGATNLIAPINRHGLLVKCDPSGQIAWSRRADASDSLSSAFADVAVNTSGDAYVCGRFSGTTRLGNISIVSQGASDALVAKYNAQGDLLWVRTGSGPANDWSYRLAIDPAGNCFIAGFFNQTITLGEVTLTNDAATNFTFVAKYSGEGNLLWARQTGPSRFRHCVAGDADGNCYLTAEVGVTNIFYAKYAPNGELLWTRTLQQNMALNRMSTDELGHCYLAGSFNAPVLAFDDFSLHFTRGYNFDSYLAKLDTTTVPRLSITAADGDISISWPVVANEYYLESTTDLAAPQSWISNAAIPNISGTRNVVGRPISALAELYRLKRE